MSLAAPLSPLKMAMTPLVLMDSVVFAAVALAALAARLLPSTFAEGWPVTAFVQNRRPPRPREDSVRFSWRRLHPYKPLAGFWRCGRRFRPFSCVCSATGLNAHSCVTRGRALTLW